MTDLHPCPACAELVVSGTCVCPHCGEKACRRSGAHGAALVLGLTLAAAGTGGCGGQAEYGVLITRSDSADTAEPTGTGTTTSAVADELASTLLQTEPWTADRHEECDRE